MLVFYPDLINSQKKFFSASRQRRIVKTDRVWVNGAAVGRGGVPVDLVEEQRVLQVPQDAPEPQERGLPPVGEGQRALEQGLELAREAALPPESL